MQSKLARRRYRRTLLLSVSPAWHAGRNANGKQGLIGTLPATLGDLQHLAVIGIGSNSLTGSLPAGFCHAAITVLDLRNNGIHGQLDQLLNCSNLWFMDVSSNKFSGLLPDIPFGVWPMLGMMDASHNDIEGPIPFSFYMLPSMSNINMAHNR